MRICLIYDCLFPYTVGGAERWYRNLAERLAADGHEVTYLTLRQWERGADPDVVGVDVRSVGPQMALYASTGRRRVAPPVVFGAGVLWHLWRHGRRYDVVHTCSFPYFSLLAAAIVRRRWRFRLVVDWFEVWSRGYWQAYIGRIGGDVGWFVQRLCARVPQHAFCFSRLYAERLRGEGMRDVQLLAGAYTGSLELRPARPVEPMVLFAGRHIPEKCAPAVVSAVARARETLSEVRATIVGDGPERSEVIRRVTELGLEGVIDVPGFVSPQMVDELMASALCVLLPSRREGYGLVVVEAAAHRTPSIVVSGPDNAAVELVSEGENGFIAPSASPGDLAEAIVRVYAAGDALRDSTARWFERNGPQLSLQSSLEIALAAYRRTPAASARS